MWVGVWVGARVSLLATERRSAVCVPRAEVGSDVFTAAQAANAAAFIDDFELKYNTRAGEAGSQLSGVMHSRR